MSVKKEHCFISLESSKVDELIPKQLNDPFATKVPSICKIATTALQEFLINNQHQWEHNFGFHKEKTAPVKGKMFGVLVVENSEKEIGYLCTFSGKFTDEPHPKIFVPSLFDITTNDHFMTKGMIALSEIGDKIKKLERENDSAALLKIEALKVNRREKSILLQQELFEQYHFLNQAGKLKSLNKIFENYNGKKPPSGAGECAAPKLLQYAYERSMRPLAIAEFWWGKSGKSGQRKHKVFYPSCNDKCRPILNYMLSNKK